MEEGEGIVSLLAEVLELLDSTIEEEAKLLASGAIAEDIAAESLLAMVEAGTKVAHGTLAWLAMVEARTKLNSGTDAVEDVTWRRWSGEASATKDRNMGRILSQRMVAIEGARWRGCVESI